MADPHSDEVFLSVLCGQSSADDPAQRHAEQLRDYYARRSAMELEDTLDDASYIRSMNYLRARGAFQARSSDTQTAKASLLVRMRHWLFPSEGNAGGRRYALVASLVIAVLAVPLMLIQPEIQPASDPGEDPFPLFPAPAPASTAPTTAVPPSPTTKAPPIAKAPLAQSGTQAVPAGEPLVLLSNDPAQLAQEVQSVLHSRGITTHLRTSSGQIRLDADINPAHLPALQQDLKVYGIQIPPTGRLSLILRKS